MTVFQDCPSKKFRSEEFLSECRLFIATQSKQLPSIVHFTNIDPNTFHSNFFLNHIQASLSFKFFKVTLGLGFLVDLSKCLVTKQFPTRRQECFGRFFDTAR